MRGQQHLQLLLWQWEPTRRGDYLCFIADQSESRIGCWFLNYNPKLYWLFPQSIFKASSYETILREIQVMSPLTVALSLHSNVSKGCIGQLQVYAIYDCSTGHNIGWFSMRSLNLHFACFWKAITKPQVLKEKQTNQHWTATEFPIAVLWQWTDAKNNVCCLSFLCVLFQI